MVVCMLSSTGNIFLGAQCSMCDAILTVECFQVIGVFPLPQSDFVGSFPIRPYLSLGGISCGSRHLPQDKISNLKVLMPNYGIVVFGYEVLVSH